MYIKFTSCSEADYINTAGTNAYFLLVTLGSSLNFTGSNIKRFWNIMHWLREFFSFSLTPVQGIDGYTRINCSEYL